MPHTAGSQFPPSEYKRRWGTIWDCSTVIKVESPVKGDLGLAAERYSFSHAGHKSCTIEEFIITTTKTPVSVNGVIRWKDIETPSVVDSAPAEPKPVVLRQEIGEVLRSVRQRQGRTLREVSHSARVSLGYLSEVERGQKEASSELLASICAALDVPVSAMLREVADRVAEVEGNLAPDTVPAELREQYQQEFGVRAH